MKIDEKKNYEALKTSDKLYNRNDAEEYLKKIENTNNKIVNLNIKNENKVFIPIYTILLIGSSLINPMLSMTLFCIYWIYGLISNLLDEKGSAKWILALIFLPFVAIFYPDYKLNEKNSKN